MNVSDYGAVEVAGVGGDWFLQYVASGVILNESEGSSYGRMKAESIQRRQNFRRVKAIFSGPFLRRVSILELDTARDLKGISLVRGPVVELLEVLNAKSYIPRWQNQT